MDSTMSKPQPISRRGVPNYSPRDGELAVEATLTPRDLPRLDVEAWRRGVGSPPGDDRNRHVYRYDILISTRGATPKVSVPYWGSIAEYEGDGDTLNALHAVEMIALDASTWHNVVCLPTDASLDEHGEEFLAGFDRLADEYDIQKPSEALRVFDACRLAARGFEVLDYDADAVAGLLDWLQRNE